MSDIHTIYRVELWGNDRILSVPIHDTKTPSEAKDKAEAKHPGFRAVNVYEDRPVRMSDQDLEALMQRNGSPAPSGEAGQKDQSVAHTHEPHQTEHRAETAPSEV